MPERARDQPVGRDAAFGGRRTPVITGGGLVARAFARRFADDPGLVVFASGVSNSSETRASEFERERALLSGSLGPGLPLVYFSSCGVTTPSEFHRPYIVHKARMEAMVLASAHGRVIRLPQVVGRTGNPNTLANFLRDRILRDEPIEVWTRAERNVVDIDDVAMIGAELIDHWPPQERVLAIAAPRSTPMPDIVAAMEHALRRTARTIAVDRGEPMPIEASHAHEAARRLSICLDEGYTSRVFNKYFGDESGS